MDKFTRKILDNVDKFSPTIIDGYARKEIGKVIEFFDETLRFARLSVRDDKFEYSGFKIMTPIEEFETEIRTREFKLKSGNIDTDTTVSDVRRIKLTFKYDDKPFWIDIFLPIVGPDGTMRISNTKYVFMPVLTDKIISAHKDHIFLKLQHHKIRFMSDNYSYFIKAPDMEEFVLDRTSIPYGKKLYGIKDIKDPKRFGVNAPLALYLLSKYTLAGINARYGVNVKIIKESEIQKYSDDGYIVYKSTGRQLRISKMIVIDKHEYAVATKSTCSFTKRLCSAILFTFDAIPSLTYDFADSEAYWRYTLGQIIFKLNGSPEGIVTQTREHMENLNRYIDDYNRIELRDMGYDISDKFNFFDLLHLLLTEFDNLMLIGISGSSSVMDKSLNVLYYVMYDIISSFNKLFSDINNNITKAKLEKRVFTHEDIMSLLKNNVVRTRAIFSISKGSSSILSLIVANVSYDNKILKMNALAEIQSNGMGVKRSTNSNGKLPLDVATLKATDIVYGSLLGLPKSFVTPRARLNPFAHFTDYGKLIIPPDLEDIIKEIDADLKDIAIKEDADTISSLIEDSHVDDKIDT